MPLHRRWLTKKEAKAIFKATLKSIDKENPSARLSCHTIPNGRGDYGYTETYSLNGQALFGWDVDGARTDVRFFTVEEQ